MTCKTSDGELRYISGPTGEVHVVVSLASGTTRVSKVVLYYERRTK